MTGWRPARWPLRTRVALAFLAATGTALSVLGVFVDVRLSAALEDGLRDTVSAEADRLEAMTGQGRVQAVEALGGEVHAQLLTADGAVLASSALVAEPLLGSGSGATGESGPRFRDAVVNVLDDDSAAAGRPDPERESFLLSVQPTENGILVVGTSREDVDQALSALRAQLLIAGPLALAVAAGLGYLVAGAGLRPIERMRARAATISARSAGERLPLPPADDELRRLAVTLNAMLDRLDDGLQRERDFVAEASHDLRTPLAMILTEIELATARPRPADELTRALHSVTEEVRRLIALTNDLLERATAEDGGLAIGARPVDLVALATRVVDRFAIAGGDRAIRLAAPRPVEVRGDASRLDRALSNLVDNALRHGDGDVLVDVRAGRDGALLTVTDHGAGFAVDDGSHSGGAGLGLSIVREIVRAHGGTVRVDRVEDRTTVHVELASPSA